MRRKFVPHNVLINISNIIYCYLQKIVTVLQATFHQSHSQYTFFMNLITPNPHIMLDFVNLNR